MNNMTDRQLDDIIELIIHYCTTVEDLERVKDNIDCLIENIEDED